MKILLFFPKSYSLDKTFKTGFESLGHEVKSFDFMTFNSKYQRSVNNKLSHLPKKIYKAYFKKYIENINKKYFDIIETEKPDLIFLYNEQLLLPDSIEKIKKICPVINFLGDNPYYYFLENRQFFLGTVLSCNYVFSPDSFWTEQMKLIGVKNISNIVFAYDKGTSFSTVVPQDFKDKFSADVLFLGSQYPNAWGYKRALFLNHFKNFNLKIYGRSWEKWFEYFPDLRESYQELTQRMTFEELNWMSNIAKVYPVDANPGILNGTHIRVLDCIASGVLPLVEYRKDIKNIFKNTELPIISNYNEIEEMTSYYLENENVRTESLAGLQKFVSDNFSEEKMANYILDRLRINKII